MGGMARYLLPVVAPAASTPAQFEALVNAALATLLASRIIAFDLVVTDKLPAYERTFQVMIDYEDGGATMNAPFTLRVLEAPDQDAAAAMTTAFIAANGSSYIAPAQYEYTDQLPNIQNRCLVFIVSGTDAANAQLNYLASATGGGSGGGAVSSVGLSAPASIFSVTGSPVTTAGVLGLALVVQAAATFFAGPILGAPAAPAFRTIRLTDLPAITFGYLSATPTTLAGYGITDAAPITHVGSNGSVQHAVATISDAGFAPVLSGSASQFLDGTGAWSTPAGGGSVSSVALSAPSQFNVTGSPITGAGTLTFAWNNQAVNTVLAGPGSGGSAAPTFRSLVIADLPAITFGYLTSTPTTLAGYGITDAAPISHVGAGGVSQHALATTGAAGFLPVLSGNPLQFLNGNGAWTVPAGSGSGSVTSVALSLPAGVFSITGSPVTVSGTLTGAFVNQSANVIFAGPASGSAAPPTFRTLVTTDLPAITFGYLTSTPTTLAGYGITDAAPISHVGAGGVSQHAIVTTSAAGFAPVLSNVVTEFLNGQGGWTAPAGGAGTVTSVGLNMPAELSVAGSPITGSGAFTVTWASEAQNTVLAAPAVGSAAPSFRLLVASDIPTISSSGVSGLAAIATSGSATDLSAGSIPAARYAATTVPISAINASGTANSSTFLRGDGTWNAPAGGGTIGGSIASTQIAIGSGTNTVAGSSAFTYSANQLILTPAATVSGAPTAFTINGATNSTNSSGIEVVDVLFQLGRISSWNAGAILAQRAFVVNAPTYSFSSASIITNAATVAISGAPSAGGNATLTNSYALWVQGGASRFDDRVSIAGTQVNGTVAQFDVTPVNAATSGTPLLMRVTGVANTNMTVSTEVIDVKFNLARPVQWAAGGSFATQRAFLIQAPTYTAITSGNITNSATFAITGAPVAGSNMTLVNTYAVWVQGGASRFDDRVSIAGNQTTGTAAHFDVAPIANGNGTPQLMAVTAAANTSIVAATEVIAVNFNLAATQQWLTTSFATQRAFVVQAPTYAFSGTSTITTAATFAITGAPIAGANATLTNAYALWVQGGTSAFGGPVVAGSDLTVGGVFTAQGTAVFTQTVTFPSIQVTGTQLLSTVAQVNIAPTSPGASGTPKLLTVTGLANTGMTTATEISDVNFNLARTVQWVSGSFGVQRAFLIQAPTYAFTGASAISNSATLAVTGAPIAGTNATLNNAYAIWVQGGATRLDGRLSIAGAQFNSTLAQFDLAPATIATTGTPLLMRVNAAPNTGMTSGELLTVDFNLSATQQFATGSIATQRAFLIRAPTYSFVGASLMTTGATFVVSGPPIAGTNATISNAYALWVQSGIAFFSGTITSNGLVTANAGVAVVGTQLNGATALLHVVPASGISTGTPKLALFTSAGNSAITLNTEVVDFDINLSTTKQWATSSSFPTQRAVVIRAPSYSAAGTSTITTAATFAITGAPAAATNMTITNAYALWVQAGLSRFDSNVLVSGTQVASGAQLTVSPSAAATSGTPSLLSVSGVSNTGMTLSTEVIDVNFNLARTVQWATGALTTQRAFVVQAPTYAFVGASGLTNAATFAITGAPVAGTNAVITNRYALWVQSGASQLDGNVWIGGQQNALYHLFVSPSAVATSGSPTLAGFFAVANTNMTASAEASDIIFSLNRTKQWAQGNNGAQQRDIRISAATYAFTGASVFAISATFAISGAPIAGANATLTKTYALWVESGVAQFDGGVTVGTTTLISSSVTLTDGAGAGAGTITNAPTAGNPTKWILINDNGTTRKIPSWT
jgi:hypothetical protein